MNTQKLSAGKLVSLIAPVYNEQAGVETFYTVITEIIKKCADYRFEIIFIDDGSTDNTLSIIKTICAQDPAVKVIEFSRNFGKESALSAGIDHAAGDAVIPIDSDLQDPPHLILQMLVEWEKGAEVVLARRASRSSDAFLKRSSAGLFYKFHNLISSVKIPDNVGDYRLMDRIVVDAIKRLPEQQRFMKGLFAWVGFKAVTIEYSRDVRAAGQTSFTGWRLWNFALEGFTGFSTAPLKLSLYAGMIGAFFSFLYMVFIVIRTLLYGADTPGFPSLVIAILFMGSLQLISLGILGEYVGRGYMESKNRPLYIVRKFHGVEQ